MKKNWYTSRITLWIFIGLAAGIVVGFIGMLNPGFFGVVKPAFDLVYNLYISALRMMIFPLVFCSIVLGIQSIGSVGKTGKVGGQTLLYYCGTTLFASLLGLFLPKLIGFGKGVSFAMDATNPYGAVEFTSLLDTVKNLIPANPVASFVNGDMLQVLVFAIIAYNVNVMLPGANYLYMARPEAAPSVLDILPPNFALRTGIIAAVITLMFGLAYLPWYLKDKKAK